MRLPDLETPSATLATLNQIVEAAIRHRAIITKVVAGRKHPNRGLWRLAAGSKPSGAMPENFPATLGQFLELIVTGIEAADKFRAQLVAHTSQSFVALQRFSLNYGEARRPTLSKLKFDSKLTRHSWGGV